LSYKIDDSSKLFLSWLISVSNESFYSDSLLISGFVNSGDLIDFISSFIELNEEIAFFISLTVYLKLEIDNDKDKLFI
jgi:hypothetical protein